MKSTIEKMPEGKEKEQMMSVWTMEAGKLPGMDMSHAVGEANIGMALIGGVPSTPPSQTLSRPPAVEIGASSLELSPNGPLSGGKSPEKIRQERKCLNDELAAVQTTLLSSPKSERKKMKSLQEKASDLEETIRTLQPSYTVSPPETSQPVAVVSATSATTVDDIVLYPGCLDDLNNQLSTAQNELLESPKSPTKTALKEKCSQLEVIIKQIHDSHKARPKPAQTNNKSKAEYTFEWKKVEGGLGLRLLEGSEDGQEQGAGVRVSYIAPDADRELQNIVGWTISKVNDTSVLDLPYGDVISLIREVGRPLSLSFVLDPQEAHISDLKEAIRGHQLIKVAVMSTMGNYSLFHAIEVWREKMKPGVKATPRSLSLGPRSDAVPTMGDIGDASVDEDEDGGLPGDLEGRNDPSGGPCLRACDPDACSIM